MPKRKKPSKKQEKPDVAGLEGAANKGIVKKSDVEKHQLERRLQGG